MDDDIYELLDSLKGNSIFDLLDTIKEARSWLLDAESNAMELFFYRDESNKIVNIFEDNVEDKTESDSIIETIAKCKNLLKQIEDSYLLKGLIEQELDNEN